MLSDADDEMAPEYDMRGWKPGRHYHELTGAEREEFVRRAALGDRAAWRRLVGEHVRAAEQAIVAHWTLVRYDGVHPGDRVWTDAPEYDEIIEDRAWMCSEQFVAKQSLSPADVQRLRGIQARADAIAERLNQAVQEHLLQRGCSPEEIGRRRDAALYGGRGAAA